MPRSTHPRKAYRPRARRIPQVIRHSAAEEVSLQLVPHLDLARSRADPAYCAAHQVDWKHVAIIAALRHALDAMPGET